MITKRWKNVSTHTEAQTSHYTLTVNGKLCVCVFVHIQHMSTKKNALKHTKTAGYRNYDLIFCVWVCVSICFFVCNTERETRGKWWCVYNLATALFQANGAKVTLSSGCGVCLHTLFFIIIRKQNNDRWELLSCVWYTHVHVLYHNWISQQFQIALNAIANKTWGPAPGKLEWGICFLFFSFSVQLAFDTLKNKKLKINRKKNWTDACLAGFFLS